MLYRLLRWIAGIALQWFYREIEVVGIHRLPDDRPLLLAVNHPNAVVDALVVGSIAPRPILLTAKATLFEHPLLNLLFRAVGIVPLRRARDEQGRDGARLPDAARNREAFRAIVDALERGQAVLIFPEGTTHDRPSLAPLRTGIARLALQARDDRGVRRLQIVPVGLTFERKWAPRTRIFVHVGEPIELDSWSAPPGESAVDALMGEVGSRLQATTLNFATADEAAEVIGIARILSGVFDRVRSLSSPDPRLADEVDIVRRIAAVRDALLAVVPERATQFRARLEALRAELARRRIAVNDVMISRSLARGAWFAIRETAVILGAGPIAWWGRVNHWAPLSLARWIARRRSRSPEDPAMYTLAVGLVLVLAAYAVQTAMVWRLAGPRWALAYLVSLPLAATWDLRFRDRMRRAALRTRTYLQFRTERGVQERLLRELQWVREEALALEGLAGGKAPGGTEPAVARREP
ncbi:MAG: 1-acyl-sn-glycerol-3-phosphate acyltransferase [Gemmatimonadaceae bacterium]